jgi:hypothetical protein
MTELGIIQNELSEQSKLLREILETLKENRPSVYRRADGTFNEFKFRLSSGRLTRSEISELQGILDEQSLRNSTEEAMIKAKMGFLDSHQGSQVDDQTGKSSTDSTPEEFKALVGEIRIDHYPDQPPRLGWIRPGPNGIELPVKDYPKLAELVGTCYGEAKPEHFKIGPIYGDFVIKAVP